MSTGRVFLFLTAVVMSALMPLPRMVRPAAAQVASSLATQGQPVLRDVQQETVTATDGTPFVILRAVVSVPELRGAFGTASGSIELAVV